MATWSSVVGSNVASNPGETVPRLLNVPPLGPVELKARAEKDTRQAVTFGIHNRARADQSFDLVHLTKSKDPCSQVEVNDCVLGEDGLPLVSHLRFAKMLEEKEVKDCALPHVSTTEQKVRAVCFSEATSLDKHAKNYSPWGVGFTKSFLYNARKANPVLYCRPEIFDDMKERYKTQPDYLRYLTPLRPVYADENEIRVGAVVNVKKEGFDQQDWSETLREGTYWRGEIVNMNRDKTYVVKNSDNRTSITVQSKMVKLAWKHVDYTHEREWRTPGPVTFQWENLSCIFVPSVKLFNVYLPDLYEKVTRACVKIVELTPTREEGDCHFGYECTKGSKCGRNHTDDQKLFFQYRERLAARNRAAATPWSE
jgi:hypothetical protein